MYKQNLGHRYNFFWENFLKIDLLKFILLSAKWFFFLEHKRNKLFWKFPNKFYFHWVENNFSMVNQNKVVFCIRIMYFDVSEWKAIDQKLGLTVWTECNTGQQSVTQDNTTKPSLQAGLTDLLHSDLHFHLGASKSGIAKIWVRYLDSTISYYISSQCQCPHWTQKHYILPSSEISFARGKQDPVL